MNSLCARLERDNAQACVKCLEEIQENKIEVNKEMVNSLGKMFQRFIQDSSIPVSLCESLLFHVGKIMECDGISFIDRFAECDVFVSAIAEIIVNFKERLVPTSDSHSSPFASHYSYELTVYILLAMLEKTALLKMFVRQVKPKVLTKMYAAMCVILVQDFLFITQVSYLNQ